MHSGIMERPDTSAVKWAWTFPNGNKSQLQNPVAQKYTKAGTFDLTAIATNSSGCADTATMSLLVHPLPIITIPGSFTKVVGVPLTLTGTYSNNVISYNWTPVATLDCSTCPQPVTNTKFNTKYTVSVVDSNSCTASKDVQVNVICKGATIFLPNSFSPNGDGANDVFYPRGTGLDRVKSLRVFNRWGQVVFEQTNFPINNSGFGWDGRYKGIKALPDVYVYQVEIFCENSEIIRLEGNIALIQ
jgi:gliding motility-associated-like protein